MAARNAKSRNFFMLELPPLVLHLFGSTGRGRFCVRRRASLGHSQRPLDRLEIHLLYIRIFPSLFGMPQGGIEDPSFTVHLAPRDGEIVIRAMNTRVVLIVQFAGIQAEKHVYLVA